ncbi:MAG: hypothetical protein ACFFB3_23440 [Candidatus Hodarchaeota archaeon]
MPLGEILSKLLERHFDYYQIEYGDEFTEGLGLFSSLDEIESLKIAPILLVTNKKPLSLIAIAYAIRLASILNANLLAMTQGIHSEMIRKEAEELGVPVSVLEAPEGQSIRRILSVIEESRVGLVIIPYRHMLRETLLKACPVAVLVTKTDRLE